MDQVLGIPEVLRSICDGLWGKDCLASALTCRALLEPSLDSLWHGIDSFEPFIHCLPDAVYTTYDNGLKFVVPLKSFTREHLERYLTFYAPRIRHFIIPMVKLRRRALATEFFLALQMIANNEPGIMAPLARRVEMQHPLETDRTLKSNLSGFLSLFIGNYVESISFPPCQNELIYTAALHANLKRLSTRLKRLSVLRTASLSNTEPYVSPYSWEALEVLRLYTNSFDVVRLAASLPQLHTLEVHNLILTYSASQDRAPSPTANDFASLRTLFIGTKRAEPSVCRIIEYLPEGNRVEHVKITSYILSSAEVGQELIKTVSRSCNPTTLKSFVLTDEGVRIGEARLELAEENFHEDESCEQPLDITPLFDFSRLEVLTIRWYADIRLSPEGVFKIPASWPRLRHLDLCPPRSPSGRLPSLNHTHLLHIVKSCPLLMYLGLRFDTTQLAGRDSDFLSSPNLTLRTLRVGDSPISSPSRVVAFIKSNFPKLEELDDEFEWPDEDHDGPTLLERHWAAVVQGLADQS